MRKAVLLLSIVAITGGCSSRSTPALPVAIAIQPLGSVSKASINLAKTRLQDVYHAQVTVLPSKPLPKAAFYKPRQRYRADTLVDHLEEHADPKFYKVVGLTESDVSATRGDIKDWGVFGWARLGQRACVVSTFRMKKNPEHRLRNITVHEVGHTLGLDHCPAPGCVMQDAKGKGETVDKEAGGFCETCTDILGPTLRVT